jgi:hypothetical protein
MGLKISTIAAIPENVERSYYLYILDYYNWDEPISKTLRESFDKIAKFAAENDSVAIQGISESHFYSELMSWESVNGIDPKELLPALMITTLHPKYFLDGDNKRSIGGKIPEDKLVFIEIAKVCKTPQDVIKIIEKIFTDIKDKKEIRDFKVKMELKGGIAKVLNDTLILEPNIAGIGVNLNNIFKFISNKL